MATLKSRLGWRVAGSYMIASVDEAKVMIALFTFMRRMQLASIEYSINDAIADDFRRNP
jgi:hypothetical protein